MKRHTYNEWVQRVSRQHNSLVVVIPKALARSKGIRRGDHLLFQAADRGSLIRIRKFRLEAVQHD